MALFGRTEALAVAMRALEEAVGSRGCTLLLTGEAGIGKSALARELAAAAEARGVRVGFGRAWEVGGAPAYWPWSQAVGELGLDLDELLGRAAGDMASAQRLVAFDRVARAVSELDGSGVMLVLDDLHAADVASLELALAFGRTIARKRVLLIATTRESELVDRPELRSLVGKLARDAHVVPLRRLDASDTVSWLSSVSFQGDAREVHRLSEGNPLFIEEAMRLGVDRFATAAAGGVAVILSEHLTRISTSAQEVLAVASVLGREASLVDVAALAGITLSDVERAVREGLQSGVLSPTKPGALVFSHVLLRDTLYGSLDPARRRSLHARAADASEVDGRAPALVAQHLLAAGHEVAVERVAQTVCRAAEAAVARHAADSAIDLIVDARARLAGRLDESEKLMFDLAEADATMRTAPSDEARARCADCADRAKALGLAAAHTRAALTYGREIITGRVDARMVSLLEEALASVPLEEASLRAQVLSRLAAALVPPRDEEAVVRAVGYAREAIAIARATEHVPTLIHTLLWSGRAFGYMIPLQERVDLTSELASLAREHGADLALADVGAFLAVSLRETGRPVAARHDAEAYYRLVESLPLPVVQWKAIALRGTMAGLDGRFDEARRYMDELRRAGASFEHANVAWARTEVAMAACTRDVDRLREVDGEVSAILRAQAALAPWQATVDALLGRVDVARSQLQPASEHTRGLPAILLTAQVAVFLESADLAKSLYDRLAREAPFGRFFWGGAGAFPMGPVSRILGELALLFGDRDRAREHLDVAIAECSKMEAAPFLALSQAARKRAGDHKTPPTKHTPSSGDVSLERKGDGWVVSALGGAAFQIKHAKGLEYIHHLLRNPGREVYVLILAGADEAPTDAGALLDERAKQSYRQRIEELEDQLAEAERLCDRGRAVRAREELEAVAEHLAAAVGLGGRDRKAASNVERARINVQRRIKDAIRRIAEHDGELGRYLDATIRTGTYCVYRPLR
jgi:hypothetical protein